MTDLWCGPSLGSLKKLPSKIVVISEWRNLSQAFKVNITSNETLILWTQLEKLRRSSVASVVFLPKLYNLSNHEEMLDDFKLRVILQNNWLILLKMCKPNLFAGQ